MSYNEVYIKYIILIITLSTPWCIKINSACVFVKDSNYAIAKVVDQAS